VKAAAAKKRAEAIAIRDAVTEHYLAHRRCCTVPDIAKALRCSTSKVYRVLDEHSGTVEGVNAESNRHRAGYSYYPNLWYLRDLVLALRVKARRSECCFASVTDIKCTDPRCPTPDCSAPSLRCANCGNECYEARPEESP
jgi:hypothetical protein